MKEAKGSKLGKGRGSGVEGAVADRRYRLRVFGGFRSFSEVFGGFRRVIIWRVGAKISLQSRVHSPSAFVRLRRDGQLGKGRPAVADRTLHAGWKPTARFFPAIPRYSLLFPDYEKEKMARSVGKGSRVEGRGGREWHRDGARTRSRDGCATSINGSRGEGRSAGCPYLSITGTRTRTRRSQFWNVRAPAFFEGF
jgi:hypothetical protein